MVWAISWESTAARPDSVVQMGRMPEGRGGCQYLGLGAEREVLGWRYGLGVPLKTKTLPLWTPFWSALLACL